MNRRNFLTATGAFLASTTLYGASAKNETFIYVGSTAKGEGEGIHMGKWDPSTGSVSDMKLSFQATQASFLVSGQKKGKKFLFSGHQPQPTMAALSSFEIDSSGSLKVINTIDLEDLEESLIQIVLDRHCDCLVSASYRSSKVFSFTVATDGKLSGPVSKFQLSGSGPNPRRQTTAHAHGAVISPDNRFALINDLGTDKIMVYKLTANSAVLNAQYATILHCQTRLRTATSCISSQREMGLLYQRTRLDFEYSQLGREGRQARVGRERPNIRGRRHL